MNNDYTLMRGAHTIKLGGSFIRFNANEIAKQWVEVVGVSDAVDQRPQRRGRNDCQHRHDVRRYSAGADVLPGSGLGGGGFGIAGAGASDREMQFAMKLYY